MKLLWSCREEKETLQQYAIQAKKRYLIARAKYNDLIRCNSPITVRKSIQDLRQQFLASPKNIKKKFAFPLKDNSQVKNSRPASRMESNEPKKDLKTNTLHTRSKILTIPLQGSHVFTKNTKVQSEIDKLREKEWDNIAAIEGLKVDAAIQKAKCTFVNRGGTATKASVDSRKNNIGRIDLKMFFGQS